MPQFNTMPESPAECLPMGAPLFSLRRWADDEVRHFLSRQSRSGFSYPEVGAMATSPPRHYNVENARIQLGQGEDVWNRLVDAVRAWQMFNIP
jgi:hypothetical protein